MSKILNICIIALMLIYYLLPFFRIVDSSLLFLLSLSICLAIKLWKRKICLTPVDISLLFIGVYCLFSPSVNRIASFAVSTNIISALMFYFLLRCVVQGNDKTKRILYCGFVIFIAFISLVSLFQFSIFDKRVFAVGFRSLYDFRFLYKPFGIPTNEWNNLQWIWGGVITATFLTFRNKSIKILCVLSGLLVWSNILLSFSRACYLAILICGLLTLILYHKNNIFHHRAAFVFGIGFVAITIFVCIQYNTEISQTLRMNETTSQQRSTKGRLNSFGIIKNVMNEYPLGVGAGNYTLAYDYYQQGETRNDTFTSYAGNNISKILVEGGYVGVLIYGLFLLSIMWQFIRTNKRYPWIVFVLLIGFFTKELFFPTFYDSRIIQLSLLVLLAGIQQEAELIRGTHKWWVMAMLPLITWIVLFIGKSMNDSPNSIPRLIHKHLYDNSEESLDKAILKSPLDVQLYYYKAVVEKDTAQLQVLTNNYPDRLMFHRTLCEWYIYNGENNHAIESVSKCIIRHPRVLSAEEWRELIYVDTTLWSGVLLRLQSILNTPPDDVVQMAKYGSIALQLGDTVLAEKYLRMAIREIPSFPQVWNNLSIIEENKGNKGTAELYHRRKNLIEFGIFFDESVLQQKETIEEPLLYDKYKFLFMKWYQMPLCK